MEIKTIKQTPHDDCTGCAACFNICPVDAISMLSDREGFLRPNISTEKCVNCGKCATTCPVLPENKKVLSRGEPECYAAWSKNDDIRFQSTSGGVFTHLAQVVLDMGGAVVGARYRNDHLVEHTLIHSKEGIEQLRQSKYVQSEVGLVFRQIESELKKGIPILFAGTPCQCSGLKFYLSLEYPNLFVCDFICRGVNSPVVYMAYLRELEEKYGSTVKKVWFKNKTFGWNNFATKIVFEDGQEYIADRETDPYMLSYLKKNLSRDMRRSCYQCQFKGVSRSTDITLADFWGVENFLTDIDTQSGVSAVMIHSEKGKRLWNFCGAGLCSYKVDIDCISQHNRCITDSVSWYGKN